MVVASSCGVPGPGRGRVAGGGLGGRVADRRATEPGGSGRGRRVGGGRLGGGAVGPGRLGGGRRVGGPSAATAPAAPAPTRPGGRGLLRPGSPRWTRLPLSGPPRCSRPLRPGRRTAPSGPPGASRRRGAGASAAAGVPERAVVTGDGSSLGGGAGGGGPPANDAAVESTVVTRNRGGGAGSGAGGGTTGVSAGAGAAGGGPPGNDAAPRGRRSGAEVGSSSAGAASRAAVLVEVGGLGSVAGGGDVGTVDWSRASSTRASSGEAIDAPLSSSDGRHGRPQTFCAREERQLPRHRWNGRDTRTGAPSPGKPMAGGTMAGYHEMPREQQEAAGTPPGRTAGWHGARLPKSLPEPTSSGKDPLPPARRYR